MMSLSSICLFFRGQQREEISGPEALQRGPLADLQWDYGYKAISPKVDDFQWKIVVIYAYITPLCTSLNQSVTPFHSGIHSKSICHQDSSKTVINNDTDCSFMTYSTGYVSTVYSKYAIHLPLSFPKKHSDYSNYSSQTWVSREQLCQVTFHICLDATFVSTLLHRMWSARRFATLYWTTFKIRILAGTVQTSVEDTFIYTGLND